MDKNFLKDVIPPNHNNGQKRSIRNIPLSESAVRKAEQNPAEERPVSSNKPEKIKYRKSMNSGISWKKIFIILIVLALIGYAGFSMATAKATIAITPESANRSVDLAFNIYNSDTATFEEGTDTSLFIPYKVEEISVTQSTSVPASGEEEVEDKARGTITVFNEYSEEAQLLIANTRFESPDGKIYRVQKAINVPGMKGGVPGQLDVEVLADEAGIEYNKDTAGVDFTIPGLKTSAPEQYSKMYAKSKTPITGGFAGVRKVVDEEDAEATRTQLRTDLVGSIQTKVSESSNEESFVIYNPENIVYASLSDTVSGESVTISEKASVPALVFDRSVISNKLAQAVLRSDSSAQIVVENLNTLSVAFEDAANFNASSAQEGIVRISGDAEFVWDIKVDELKESFKGMSKSELTETLTNTAGVSRAKISIKPFWKQSVPQNIDKIDIVIEKETAEETNE